MPRTPLLAAFHDLSPLLGRRRFLRGGATAAGLLATTRFASLRGALPRGSSVAIVGAGLAGLTCARRLQQAGVVASVHEAAMRLGGRCWTRRGDFADGQIAEHGGELIDQSHTAIRHLAQELGLRLDNQLRAETNGTEAGFYFGGARYPYAEASRDLHALWQPMHRDLVAAGYPTTYATNTDRGRALDAMSLHDWIEATVPGGLASRLGQLLAVAYEIEYGAAIDEQSALNLLYLLAYSGPGRLRIFGPSNEKYHVRGGNDQLVTGLAAPLTNQIRVDERLVALRLLSDGRYRLTFATAAGLRDDTVDHVVLAVPFAVLAGSVDLAAAGLSPRKRQAIHELGRGRSGKLNVQFQTRLWNGLRINGETFSDRGYQATWEVSRGQPGAHGILVNYTGGAIAGGLVGADPQVRAQVFLGQIEPLLPGASAQWNGRATLDTWHEKPLSACSYSYYRPGQYVAFGGVEGEREGNVSFCGEHTSRDAQGYLEGAVETGERAAAEVVAALRGR